MIMNSVQLLAILSLWTSTTRSLCNGPNDLDCLSNCLEISSCIRCLSTIGCGWCSLENAEGWCVPFEARAELRTVDRLCNNSYYRGPKISSISSTGAIRFINSTCPVENECENGRHNCDTAVERCVDMEHGFGCSCKDGYVKKNDVCVPSCPQGCVNGICIGSDRCQCHFGFVGIACQSACNCYGHSTCPGTRDLDTCVKCHNNTMGSHCELCEYGYLRSGNLCLPCGVYCHNHSESCLNAKAYNIQAYITASPEFFTRLQDEIVESNTLAWTTPAVCANCSNFTKGLKCEFCLPGYFRPPKSTPFSPCMKCDCNGHSVDNVCNPQRGDGCECQNNTMTPNGCRDDCWKHQCTTCKEKFRGYPLNGHQCYREILEADHDVHLKPDSDGSHSLQPMELSFFALTPEFSNVDIRIVLDVGQGVLDAFLATSDVFTATYDSTAGCHWLSFRSEWSVAWNEIYPNVNNLEEELGPCVPGYGASWTGLQIADANDMVNFITYNSPSSILIVKNIANRAVIIAHTSVFDLKSTKFYLVMRARHSSTAGVWGNLLYTQDQSHFDLFIFFAVFFAAFFLGLSVALVVWRVRTLRAERRHDRVQMMELLKLAKRPFTKCCIFWDDKCGSSSKNVEIDAWPISFQDLRKKPATVATLLVKMPGDTRAPVKMALATALLWTNSAAKNPRSDELNDSTQVIKRKQQRYFFAGRCRIQPC